MKSECTWSCNDSSFFFCLTVERTVECAYNKSIFIVYRWSIGIYNEKSFLNMSSDFSKGRVWRNIIDQAIPLTLAQLVQLLYNVVDRVYIGHLGGSNNLALTGIGLTFPVITLIAAFTALFGTGGAPLFSIARGAKKDKEAEKILGNVFTLLTVSSVLLLIVSYLFRKPILYLFGASDASYVYADEYLRIYLLGTTFSMVTTGLNGFINAQGFPRFGMLTTLLGAVLNLILDPLFIFVFDMGVAGAAIATVLSQVVSATWVLWFLTGKRAILRLKRSNMRIDMPLTAKILELGLSGFIMQATTCLVQVVCNATLQSFGGDLYVGIMTVIGSVRDVVSLPVSGLSHGAQPVLGYNYGAKEYGRVKEGIRFMSFLGLLYTLVVWIAVLMVPQALFRIFTSDVEMIAKGPVAMNLYFFGFVFMALQFAGQMVFTALGHSRRAIFFSLLRKAIIVAPLTVLLPRLGLGVYGVFLAEPISNIIGGTASFVAMWMTVYRKL